MNAPKLSSGTMLKAAQAAELAANAPEGSPEARRAEMAAMAELERLQIAAINEKMSRLSQTPRVTERLPLRDDGHDFGRVESRIPRDLFFHLLKQKNMGWDGLASAEGQRDILKAYPACAVKTVSSQTSFGYTGSPKTASQRRSNRGVVFGRGTLNLAT
jgi:hypothetical protein